MLDPQFDYAAMRQATRYYIPTQFQNASPAREDEPGFTHQHVIRSPLIPFFLKNAFDHNAGGKTHPAGRLNPNELGLHDMSGNVWEWCSDWFDEGYYQFCKSQGQVEGPLGPASGTHHVLRGGSWYLTAGSCRVAFRDRSYPVSRHHTFGFHLAFAPPAL